MIAVEERRRRNAKATRRGARQIKTKRGLLGPVLFLFVEYPKFSANLFREKFLVRISRGGEKERG